ncbi:hypothetical protein Sste5346_002488 [Sporothrix stenoceras]|uniref:RING-type domain-containing protein n=1 Tax=Sporothrix stenoceras TaxID=5173 RepID=A0ABR3ZK35_9PEZI
MARRVPTADSTEGSFALDRSGPSNDPLPSDESASISSDYFSDYFDLDQLADIEFGNVNENVVNDDETDDEDILSRNPLRNPPAHSQQQPTISLQRPPAQSASQPAPASRWRQVSYGNQIVEASSSRLDPLPPLAPPPIPSRTLNHSDSAINIDDGEDDDDLEFLGQNDFSSPSILNDFPSRVSRVSEQITLSSDDEAEAVMPQTRRRSAASRSVSVADPFPLPLPGDPIAAASTATPARSSRTRAGSNTLTSQVATATITATPSAVRSSNKRRRSHDPGVGSSSTALPPIATLLASVGNGSISSNNDRAVYGDSQASSSSSSSGNNATSQTSRPRLSPKRQRVIEPIVLDDDLFGSDDDDVGVEIVNLVDVDRPQAARVKDEAVEGAPAEPLSEAKEEPKNLTKLSAQQCVICMDDMTDITVTHCGHLFCGECLFSSLNSTDQRVCPICRSKVEMRVPQMSQAKMSRSYFPLQLKMRPQR